MSVDNESGGAAPKRRRPKSGHTGSGALPAGSAVHETDSKAPVEEVIIGEKPPQSLRRSARLSDGTRNPLTLAFLTALVSGLFAVFYAPAMEGMVVAVAAMVIYFVFGLLVPKTTRNTEQFADSLYYMGFILTLGALFLAMAPGFQASEITSREIIQKFGLAILTTFIGMSLRIILLQLRHTASDQEEEAREAIAGYVVSLQTEVRDSIIQLRAFRQQVIEDAKESANDITRHVDALGNATGTFVSHLTTFTSGLTKTTDELKQSIAGSTAAVDALEKVVGSTIRSLAEMGKQSDGSSQTMAKVRAESETIAAALQQFRKVLDEYSTTYRTDIEEITRELKTTASEVRADSEAYSTQLVSSAKLIRDALQDVRRK